jgi:hypothetical protein
VCPKFEASPFKPAYMGLRCKRCNHFRGDHDGDTATTITGHVDKQSDADGCTVVEVTQQDRIDIEQLLSDAEREMERKSRLEQLNAQAENNIRELRALLDAVRASKAVPRKKLSELVAEVSAASQQHGPWLAHGVIERTHGSSTTATDILGWIPSPPAPSDADEPVTAAAHPDLPDEVLEML